MKLRKKRVRSSLDDFEGEYLCIVITITMALDKSEVRVDFYPFMDLKDKSQMADLISGEIQRT